MSSALYDSPIQQFEQRKGELKLERSSFIPHYEALSQFVQPRRGRFFVTDRNKGGDRYTAIINSKATQAHRTARSGLLNGVMSPARPWFLLETNNPDLNEDWPSKIWLYKVAEIIRAICNMSNLYTMAPGLFGELLLFGTGVMLHVDDFEDVARFYTLTAGSYMIGQDDRQVVNTIIREYEMTVSQLVQKWGLKNVSDAVRTQYDNGSYDKWYPVTHIIQPNNFYSPGNKMSEFKKFQSAYYEPGNPDKYKLLSKKGFDEFPAYAPTWDTTAEDIYGTDCPAMTALGDIRGLQIEERRKAQAIDKMVNPPMKGGAAMRNVPVDSLPGGLTIYDGDMDKGLSPLYQMNISLQELRLDITAVEQRIDDAFYIHLFRAISDMAGVQPRNQLELTQRDQERLLELGPVLENLEGKFLNQLVDRLFSQCVRAKILPPAPPQLQGKALKVRYISSLAMAQRSVEAGTIERMTTFVAGLVTGGFQSAADKLDVDKTIDKYASVTGFAPTMIVPTEQANQVRQARAAAQAAQEKLAATASIAKSSKDGAAAAQSLGSIPSADVPGTASNPMGGDTVLKAISQAVQRRGNTNLFNQPKSIG